MAENWQEGDWLLIDAAGPQMVIGILRNGKWLDRHSRESEALEHIGNGSRELLKSNGLKTGNIRGCLYASGPGSTLGLRLAAMFLRGLMELPAHRAWICYCYNNLELACADLWTASSGPTELAAPWRRDRFHLARFDPSEDPAMVLNWVPTEHVESSPIQIVRLGRRPPRLPGDGELLPYPVDHIPSLLQAWPMLARKCPLPAPYSAEEPEFAKWSPQRHGAS